MQDNENDSLKLLTQILCTADRIADKLVEITEKQKEHLELMEEFHNRQVKVLSYMEQKKMEASIERELTEQEIAKLRASVLWWVNHGKA